MNSDSIAAVPAADNKEKSGRIFELDALRAIAALNLMLFHFTWVYSEKYGFTTDILYKYPYGKYGTQLFFMLSGLVNAMTLMRKQSASYYIQSRFIRILPPFLLVLGLNLLLVQMMPLRDHIQLSPAMIAANATLLPNLLGYECIEPVIWTLQIEIQFYVVLLLLFALGALRRPFWPIMGCLSFCLVFGYLSNQIDEALVGAKAYQGLQWLNAALIVEYFPLFALGMLIHQGYLEKNQWLKYGSGIAVAAMVYHGIETRDGSPVATLLLIGLLLACQFGKLPILRSKPLLFISGISYSLYLLHNNLGTVIIYYLNQMGISPLLCFILASGLVIIISAIAAYTIERPLGRIVRRVWATAGDWLKSRDVLARCRSVVSASRPTAKETSI
ncbi:MAG: acyltransferase [Planctomycetaceae bacterium]|nr:acyltransferase [Planctomycetaceae bacterium]